ncbi:hypothetical protein [uncultured Polaribacter sp.]|uniref:hypothetical protein n=1 Tax=uncultured Polaribacter sp. TaxID=174711 RepID=UPI002620AEAE|nr:hypothetical protein [uncultured Polaribacter sp.]
MKNIIVACLLLSFSANFSAQKKKSTKMGQTTLKELKMQLYEQDSTANAVVLYEHANVYLDEGHEYQTRTDYYYRIKIFNKAAFNLADININLFKDKSVKDLKAITYNLSEGRMVKNYLQTDKIFSVKEGENWTVKKFTLPNVQEGAVLEYKYSIISPYLGLDDWVFQSEIPKIKSEYDAAILGNYKYNIRIIGFNKLDKDKPSVDKKCVFIDGIGQGACAIYSYGMYNIPAFKEEDFMLSKKNYISRLSFDLESYTSPEGKVQKYTTTWEQADKKLKSQFFNNQLSKKKYFKKRLPEQIFTLDNNLQKAQEIYSFIQNHFTWNNYYWSSEDAKVKDAFTEKSGNVSEINLALFNSLRAAELEATLVVLSTRNNGMPTKLYPIIYDYNYVVVKTIINGKAYFLDATEKYLPFGQLPVRTLNGEAREISFKEDGTWIVLKPKYPSSKNINADLTLNAEGEFTGKVHITKMGYYAAEQREKIALLTEEALLEDFETSHPDLEVNDYKVTAEKALDKPLKETYDVTIFMDENLGNTTRINPFLFNRLKENPFKLKERLYPVDFGRPFSHNFALRLKIPENYTIVSIPESKAMQLPNNGGFFVINTTKLDNVIKVYARFKISKKSFSSNDYFALKEFFNQIIIAEKAYVVLKKKS